MHELQAAALLEAVQLNNKLLFDLRKQEQANGEELRKLTRIVASLLGHINPNYRVLGGVMSQQGEPMADLVAITPGSTPGFTVTPVPNGVTTEAANAKWTSSDDTNAPVTANADDATGLTATVAVSSSAAVGSSFGLTWTYTNPDGTTAVVSKSFTVVAPPVPDVIGGDMEQTS